ncbi:hypothetical protein Ciccas_000340 [Cichlidogyrus casuarinus]|uniref:Uncharacterized protein n=1 Tax=Cichlidogyrus casuarinus TaxID=1844966 RepID=A0ABD2QN64_9PLAT
MVLSDYSDRNQPEGRESPKDESNKIDYTLSHYSRKVVVVPDRNNTLLNKIAPISSKPQNKSDYRTTSRKTAQVEDNQNSMNALQFGRKLIKRYLDEYEPVRQKARSYDPSHHCKHQLSDRSDRLKPMFPKSRSSKSVVESTSLKIDADDRYRDPDIRKKLHDLVVKQRVARKRQEEAELRDREERIAKIQKNLDSLRAKTKTIRSSSDPLYRKRGHSCSKSHTSSQNLPGFVDFLLEESTDLDNLKDIRKSQELFTVIPPDLFSARQSTNLNCAQLCDDLLNEAESVSQSMPKPRIRRIKTREPKPLKVIPASRRPSGKQEKVPISVLQQTNDAIKQLQDHLNSYERLLKIDRSQDRRSLPSTRKPPESMSLHSVDNLKSNATQTRPFKTLVILKFLL